MTRNTSTAPLRLTALWATLVALAAGVLASFRLFSQDASYSSVIWVAYVFGIGLFAIGALGTLRLEQPRPFAWMLGFATLLFLFSAAAAGLTG